MHTANCSADRLTPAHSCARTACCAHHATPFPVPLPPLPPLPPLLPPPPAAGRRRLVPADGVVPRGAVQRAVPAAGPRAHAAQRGGGGAGQRVAGQGLEAWVARAQHAAARGRVGRKAGIECMEGDRGGCSAREHVKHAAEPARDGGLHVKYRTGGLFLCHNLLYLGHCLADKVLFKFLMVQMVQQGACAVAAISTAAMHCTQAHGCGCGLTAAANGAQRGCSVDVSSVERGWNAHTSRNGMCACTYFTAGSRAQTQALAGEGCRASMHSCCTTHCAASPGRSAEWTGA